MYINTARTPRPFQNLPSRGSDCLCKSLIYKGIAAYQSGTSARNREPVDNLWISH